MSPAGSHGHLIGRPGGAVERASGRRALTRAPAAGCLARRAALHCCTVLHCVVLHLRAIPQQRRPDTCKQSRRVWPLGWTDAPASGQWTVATRQRQHFIRLRPLQGTVIDHDERQSGTPLSCAIGPLAASAEAAQRHLKPPSGSPSCHKATSADCVAADCQRRTPAHSQAHWPIDASWLPVSAW